MCTYEDGTGHWTKEKLVVTSSRKPLRLGSYSSYVTIDQAGEFIRESWNPAGNIMQYDMYVWGMLLILRSG
jgi:hypothetical protein